MNRTLFKTIVALTLSLLTIIGTTPPTSANDRDLVDKLIEVYPSLKEVPADEILSDFKNQAEEAGLPPDQFLAQIIEATRLNDEAMRQPADKHPAIQAIPGHAQRTPTFRIPITRATSISAPRLMFSITGIPESTATPTGSSRQAVPTPSAIGITRMKSQGHPARNSSKQH